MIASFLTEPLQRYRPFLEALYRLYENSGFSMAGAVAFSFVISLFPFCIFLGALASVFGGRALADRAISEMFAGLPRSVAEALAPQIEAIMGQGRVDLLTFSGLIALFFATSANETMRAALNGAYRVAETRPYPYCLGLSMLFVLATAIGLLVVTAVIVIGPKLANFIHISWLRAILDSSILSAMLRFVLAGGILAVLLLAMHLWLAAGSRTISDVWPGVLLSIVLWLVIAALYARYLEFSDYTRFYAGLSQVMVALIFFQATAVAILPGAELNRGVIELKKLALAGM
jgi:membrane protein